jgi:hypothetical protein
MIRKVFITLSTYSFLLVLFLINHFYIVDWEYANTTTGYQGTMLYFSALIGFIGSLPILIFLMSIIKQMQEV